MAIFQDVTLEWNGEAFTVPSDRVLGAIAIVEEQITFPQLLAALANERAPLVAISKAFAGVLRYAGANVSDEDVYRGMFDGAVQDQTVASINTLLVMMVPPDAMAKMEGGNAPGKTQATTRKSSKKTGSSRRSTKR